MPGFFETMSRMFKGEPVYQTSDEDSTEPQEDKPTVSAKAAPPRSNRTDGKIVPLVKIDRVECHIDGTHMILSVEVKNHHTQPIYLDKILILNTRFELDRDMKGDEEHTFVVYKGARPATTHLTRCELHYRDSAGDYFSAIHFVEFRQLQDGMFVVDEIRFLPPIKDI